MTPEEQRIAIAEACGWRYDDSMEMWLSPSGIHFFEWQIPDYPNDLNAMHEAEKVFTETSDRSLYQEWLASICVTENNRAGEWFLVHATAAQRAEAFLRTLGKWKE